MSIIQMFSAGVTTADAVAVVDVQMDGVITCVEWVKRIGTSTGPGGINSELSFGSTSAFTTNDARQVISRAQVSGNVVAGTSNDGVNTQVMCEVPVFAGERLYLHNALSGIQPTTAQTWCLIHIRDKAARTSRMRA